LLQDKRFKAFVGDFRACAVGIMMSFGSLKEAHVGDKVPKRHSQIMLSQPFMTLCGFRVGRMSALVFATISLWAW